MGRVAIVCHDAGGAEILSSWLLRSNDLCFVVAVGPAVSIFDRKCVAAERMSLVDAIEKSDWVLCGTGITNLERKAIKLGREKGKKTVAFIDHWVNYTERFQDDDYSLILPDEIWVGDEDALLIAKKEFSNIPIKLKINPYFEDVHSRFLNFESTKPSTSKISILYVCEPISVQALISHGNTNFYGYTEVSAMKYFLENIDSLCCDISQIIIRPHPTECRDKYHWVKALAPKIIKFGGVKTLIEEMIEVDVVVGCETMAMVIGLIAGKRVISCIPPGGNPMRLPQARIEKMQNLVEKRP